MVAPDRVTWVALTAAVTTPPLQSVEALGVGATVRPVGRLSVKLTPVKVVFGCCGSRVLNRRIFRVAVCPTEILVGVKLLDAPSPCRVDRVAVVWRLLV